MWKLSNQSEQKTPNFSYQILSLLQYGFCHLGFSESFIRYFLPQIFGTLKPSYIAGVKFRYDANEYVLRNL